MVRKTKLLATAGLIAIVWCGNARAQQNWKMKPAPVATNWAAEVSPDNALTAYPRPQMVRKNWKNLNGLWEYAIVPKDAASPDVYNGHILVPYPIESALSGVKAFLSPNQDLWYKRSFQVSHNKGERVLLHFGAVDWQTTVFVNGKQAGTHTGGYQSFSFDITEHLQENNQLLVKVYDPTDLGHNPKGKQTLNPSGMYYSPSSGIWQTVWLEVVPAVAIQSLKLTPDIDAGSLTLKVSSNTAAMPGYTVQAHLTNAESASSTKGKLMKEMKIAVPSAHLWSPEDPFLYTMKVRLLFNGKAVDSVDTYFGMRKITVKKDDKGINKIFLNNQPYFNLGTLDQGFWPDGLYTAATDEALAFDIKAIKAMGFNTIRKHIKIEPARWYYHCDQLGMLVWQDMVNAPNDEPDARQEFERETNESVDMLYNHPSIVTWVLFNEGWGAFDQERLTSWLKQKDPSRIVNGHSGENFYRSSPEDVSKKWPGSDVTDLHSYPNPELPPMLAGKALVLGEFGGVAARAVGHQWDDTGDWGYVKVSLDSLAKSYAVMANVLKDLRDKGLCASIYTQPFDVESEQNGLISYDRKVIKVPLEKIRALNEEVLQQEAGNKTKASGLAQLTTAVDEDKYYPSKLEEFKKGGKDSIFIRQLALMGYRLKDTANYQLVLNAYMELLKDPVAKENLAVISKLTSTVNDPGFALLLANQQVLVRNREYGDFLEKLKQIVARKEIAPFTARYRTGEQWDSLKIDIIRKYGAFADEIVERNQLANTVAHQQWKDFPKVAVPYLQKYSLNLDARSLNNFAWNVFLNVSDSTVLELALSWMNIAMQKDSNAAYFDTYANLLYKLGKKEEAYKWQQRAIDHEPSEPSFKETLQRMKRGLKTWN